MWGIADNQRTSAARDGQSVANQPLSSDLRRAEGLAPLDSVLGIQESGPAFTFADQMGATLMAQWGTAPGSIAEDAYPWNCTAGAIMHQPSAAVGHRAPKSARLQWVTAVLLLLLAASSLVMVGGLAAGHDDRAAVTEIGPAPLVTLGALPEGAAIDGSLG